MADQSLFSELRERKVVQVAAIYGAVAWGLTEVVVTIVQQLFLPSCHYLAPIPGVLRGHWAS